MKKIFICFMVVCTILSLTGCNLKNDLLKTGLPSGWSFTDDVDFLYVALPDDLAKAKMSSASVQDNVKNVFSHLDNLNADDLKTLEETKMMYDENTFIVFYPNQYAAMAKPIELSEDVQLMEIGTVEDMLALFPDVPGVVYGSTWSKSLDGDGNGRLVVNISSDFFEETMTGFAMLLQNETQCFFLCSVNAEQCDKYDFDSSIFIGGSRYVK